MKQVIAFCIAGVLCIGVAVGVVLYNNHKEDAKQEASEAMHERIDDTIIATPNWPVYSLCKEMFPNAEVRFLGEYGKDVRELKYYIDEEADFNLYLMSTSMPLNPDDSTMPVDSGFMDYMDDEGNYYAASYTSPRNIEVMIDNIAKLCQDDTFLDIDVYESCIATARELQNAPSNDTVLVFDVCDVVPLISDLDYDYAISDTYDYTTCLQCTDGITYIYDFLTVPEGIEQQGTFLSIMQYNVNALNNNK